ncbi:MAG TPA: hypothetical protein ENL22_02330 [candidate division Zixibacteria bacterium]|nr:hypothetical protein [candidate division Zixibacteria bacterium]
MIYTTIKKICNTSSLLLCLFMLPVSTLAVPTHSLAAGNTMIQPSIQIQDGYDSNIGFTRANETEDYYTDISAGLALNYETELLQLRGAANAAVVRYARENQNDYERYMLDLSGGYQLVERTRLNFGLSYVDDITLRSELEETGLFYIRSVQQKYSASAGFTRQLSEVSTLGFNYNYTKTEYGWAGNTDNNAQQIVLSYARSLSNQRDSVKVQPSYSRTSSRASDVDTYGLSFGWNHAFSEMSKMNILIGEEYSKITSSLAQPLIVYNPTLDPPWAVIYNAVNRIEEKWNFVADINLEKTGERYSTVIGYNHDLSYSSLGEPTQREKFYLQGTLTLSERLKAGLSGNLYFNQSESESYKVDTRYYQLTTYLSYQLTRNGSFRVEYSYANDKDNTLSGDNVAERQTVLISLNFGFSKGL